MAYGAPAGLGIVLVTQTSIVHCWLALIVPPVQVMVFVPVIAVSVPPIQAAFFVAGVGRPAVFTLLIVTPVGSGSVIEKFVRLVSLGARTVIRNLELPPTGMLEGENDFVPITSVLTTVKLALTGVRRPIPWDVVKPVVGMIFVNMLEGVPIGTVT